MSDHQEAKQATPPETLLAELLDSRVPKSEREHAAKREIERLTAALRAQPGPVNMDDVEWAGKAHLQDARTEIERLRAVAQHEADCAEAYRAQVETMIRERDELRKQIDECSQMLARQARTIRELTRPAEES